jgi:phage-related tail fiber protein
MAVESIGVLVPTVIPGYADAADIQAALRAYHYGSYSYDPANTSPAGLINPSIAYTINDIQSQVTTNNNNAVQKSLFTAKGDLLSSSASNTPLILASGSNSQYLRVNTATSTGLEWGDLPSATTSVAGIVQLTDSTASTSTTTAATPNSVKSAYDLADAAVPKSTVTTKGDLIVGTTTSTVTRLAAGTNGYFLVADSSTTSGLAWTEGGTGSASLPDIFLMMGG